MAARGTGNRRTIRSELISSRRLTRCWTRSTAADPRKFADELGDLLLQIVFHAELAAEAGKFDIADVIEQIYTKMVRRHPHVFGKVRAETSADVLKNWEQLKAEERARSRFGKQKLR